MCTTEVITDGLTRSSMFHTTPTCTSQSHWALTNNEEWQLTGWQNSSKAGLTKVMYWWSICSNWRPRYFMSRSTDNTSLAQQRFSLTPHSKRVHQKALQRNWNVTSAKLHLVNVYYQLVIAEVNLCTSLKCLNRLQRYSRSCVPNKCYYCHWQTRSKLAHYQI